MQVRPAFIVSGVSPDPREGKDYESGGALVWCTTHKSIYNISTSSEKTAFSVNYKEYELLSKQPANQQTICRLWRPLETVVKLEVWGEKD